MCLEKMDEFKKLLKELEEMPEEEARRIARDHLRFRERLARSRAQRSL